MEQSLSLIEPYSNNLLSNAKYTKKHKPKSQTKKHKKQVIKFLRRNELTY